MKSNQKIEIMRRVDKYAGIIICWIFSMWNSLISIFEKKTNGESQPQKILILKPAEMGVCVLLYPMLLKLKDMFKDAELYFVTFEENVSIMYLLNVIPREHIFTLRIDKTKNFIFDTLSVISKARKIKIDTVIDLEFFSRYTTILGYLTGAKRRVGYFRFNSEGLYRGNLLTHKVSYNYYRHIGVMYLALVNALKYPPGKIILNENLSVDSSDIPKINTTQIDKINIWNKLSELNYDIKEISRNRDNVPIKLVIFVPKTSEWLPFKEWPLQYFVELGKKLIDKHKDIYIVVTGTAHATQIAQELISGINNPSRCINLVGKTTLKELIDLYGIAHLLISADSGPAHFASLTDIKIIAIFGPETPTIFAPLSKNSICLSGEFACQPCFSIFNGRRSNCSNKISISPCLIEITPDKVYNIIKNIEGFEEPSGVG